MRLDKAAKEIFKLLVKSVPGSSIILAAFDEEVDQVAKRIFPQAQVNELEISAKLISEVIASSSSPYLDKNPGASVSAAYDFLDSVKAANITFFDLLDCDFVAERVEGRFYPYKPIDWNYASGQRRELWSLGISLFTKQLIHFYLTTPRYQGYIMAEILRRGSSLIEKNPNKSHHATTGSGGVCDEVS